MGFKTATILPAFALLALAACSSTPDPNPRLMTLQSQLNNGYTDTFIADKGAAQLRQADAALKAATAAWSDRDEALADHNMELADAYIAQAQLKGGQGRAAADIETLKLAQTDVRLQSRERQITDAERRAAEQAALAQQQTATAQATQSELDQLRQAYQIQQRELGATLVLQDVMFETNSAVLRPGADNRLQPLARYLQGNGKVQIRIEGHTDSRGSDSYNQELSARRAESVATALAAMGIDRSRIQTVGMGEGKPIASNDTVSGREQNRRVEVTLLSTSS